MTSWQTRVRIALVLFLVALGVTVYLAFGPRPARRVAPPVERLDPAARSETTAARLQRVRGEEQEFEVAADVTLTYEDGSVRQTGVRITARNRGGRDFLVRAREARSGPNERILQLLGDVSLTASDGFELNTGEGAFDRTEGVATAPGEVGFRNGARLRGSGLGMRYDERGDVLTVRQRPAITMTDAAGRITSEFSADAAVLDRTRDVLVLDSNVHATRGGQVMRAGDAVVHLSSGEEFVTSIALSGGATVEGSGPAEAMSARDLTLIYTPDGRALERAVLTGSAVVTLAATDRRAARTLSGAALDLHLAEDGSVVRATGTGGVRLVDPGDERTGPRWINGATLDASGRQGAGLTEATFAGGVEYREPRGEDGDRIVRARSLRATLVDGGVSSALFTGDVSFTGDEMTARAPQLSYQPEAGALVLTAGAGPGEPHVDSDRLTLDARSLTVDLETGRITAAGAVRTTIKAQPAGGRPADRAKPLPGLLRSDGTVGATAGRFTYAGGSGAMRFDGQAAVWQEEVAVWGDSIVINPDAGAVRVAGSARSSVRSDTDASTGAADVIRYDDATRRLVLLTAPEEGAGGAVERATGALARLAAGGGEIRARRVEVGLAADSLQTERIDALGDVTLDVDRRRATGARLSYVAAEARYLMRGDAQTPVLLVESCSEITGNTLTFFKGADRIVVDGDSGGRSRTRTDGSCAPAGAR